MRLLIPLLCLSLVACAHNDQDTGLATAIQIPDAPAHLMKKAESLPQMTDLSMGGQQIESANTDKQYNQVAYQLNNLIDLYRCVQKSINDKKLKECFE